MQRPVNHCVSLDLAVPAHARRSRNGNAKRLGRLHVDHEIELGRPLDRNVGRLGALENLVDENWGSTIECEKIHAVTEESPCVGVLDEADRGKTMSSGAVIF